MDVVEIPALVVASTPGSKLYSDACDPGYDTLPAVPLSFAVFEYVLGDDVHPEHITVIPINKNLRIGILPIFGGLIVSGSMQKTIAD